MSKTRKEIIEALKELLEQDVMAIRDQVDHLKTQFYTSDEEAESEQEEAKGEQEETEAVASVPTEEETEFKALLAQYKAKRAEVAAAQAKEEEENLRRKQAILDEMAKMVESGDADAVMSNLQRMRELQAEWKTIGPVPAPQTQSVRKAYQQYQEQFYDLVKINIELRDLDFKKNLELKTLLCEAAERLENNDNIVEASRALQQLHDEWSEIGPVARELREELWERFKAASTVINKKHQAFFDQIHAKEKENLERKQVLIIQLKELNAPIVAGETLAAKRWEELTEKVQAIQTEWRTIGFAPKKQNQSIYDAYREECNRFYQAKTAHFREIRDTFGENLKQKRSLLERAKAIAAGIQVEAGSDDSVNINWTKAADELRELQAEWKKIGPVARKYSNDLWKQFSEACDTFFEAKRDALKSEKIREKSERAARAAKAAANQGIDGLRRLRDRLQQEIKVAENNILFFTAKSKTANKLVDSMQKKIDELKQKLAEIQDQMDREDE